MNKLFINIVLTLILISKGTEALRCYSCSYTSTGTDATCLDDPASVSGQGIVTCSKRYCTIQRQELTDPAGKVNTFLRGCEESPLYLNELVEDDTFKTYFRACQTDLCNEGDGITGTGSNVSPDAGPGENLLVPGLPGSSTKIIGNVIALTLSGIALLLL